MKTRKKIGVYFITFIIILTFCTPFAYGESFPEGNITFKALGTDAKTQQLLSEKAGISAYIKVDSGINLNSVKSEFETIETSTSDYIIGTFPLLSDYGKKLDPNLFIHKNGLIVCFYPKGRYASLMMDWDEYDGSSISTTLETTIKSLGSALNKDMTNYPLNYYHFDYPEAENLSIIVDGESYHVTIPRGTNIYEASGNLGTSTTYGYCIDFGINTGDISVGNKIEFRKYLSYGDASFKISDKTILRWDLDNTSEANTVRHALFLIY